MADTIGQKRPSPDKNVYTFEVIKPPNVKENGAINRQTELSTYGTSEAVSNWAKETCINGIGDSNRLGWWNRSVMDEFFYLSIDHDYAVCKPEQRVKLPPIGLGSTDLFVDKATASQFDEATPTKEMTGNHGHPTGST
jgi:hypothetical protein